MATAKANKTKGLAPPKGSSRQPSYANAHLKQSETILSLKASTVKESNQCDRFEEHNRLWQARCNSAPPISALFSYRSHGNNPDTCDYNIKSQTSGRLFTSRSRSNVNASSTPSISSHQRQESPSTLPDPSKNIKDGKSKSRIPIRIPNSILPLSFINKQMTSNNKRSKIPRRVSFDHFSSPTRHAPIEISSEIYDNEISSSEDQPTTEVKVQGTKTDQNCTGILQLNDIETKDKTDTLSVTNIVNDSVFPNKQNDSYEAETNTNSNDAIYTALLKEQAELKAYYDNFPNINDAIDEEGSHIKEARKFTDSLLKKLPSGDVDDRDTLCHVLKNLLGTEDHECLFYDSENGIDLHDASLNLVDISSEDRPFVLKLKSSEGLGNRSNVPTEQDDLKLVQILTDVMREKKSHPVLEDIIERLSNAHHVTKQDIVIRTVYVGTWNIVYTILDLPRKIIETLTETYQNLKNQFKQFVSAKIHPLLYRPSFDIAYFDARGNKSFSKQQETFQVGPPGRTKAYTTASGWRRYGLKVLSNKDANHDWLDPFQHPGNWYRAFHGTGRARTEDFQNKEELFDQNYARVDALSSIHLNGFRQARVHRHGAGVYCFPNPQFPEEGYIQPVPLETVKGQKTFSCMLQVAVNPDGVQFTKHTDIWVVPDPKDIRPYGILIKETN